MFNCLFHTNVCQFHNCGLHFRTLSHLLQHIEEIHTAPFETQLKGQEDASRLTGQDSSQSSDDTKSSATSSVATTLPLSSVCRVFSVLPQEKATPIAYQPTQLSFCHYKKKIPQYPTTASPVLTHFASHTKAATPVRPEMEEDISNDSLRNELNEEGDSCVLADDRRYKYSADGCIKRYKNLQGRRQARQIHVSNDEPGVAMTTSDNATSSGSQSPLAQPPQSQSKNQNVRPYKCDQCSKRYKTPAGLSNHVRQTHQRIITNAQNYASGLYPVSPSAVSNATDSHSRSPSSSMESIQKSRLTQSPLPGVRVSTTSQFTQNNCSASAHPHHSSANATSIQVRSVGNVASTSRAPSKNSSHTFYNSIGGIAKTDILFTSENNPPEQTEEQEISSCAPQIKPVSRDALAFDLGAASRFQYRQGNAQPTGESSVVVTTTEASCATVTLTETKSYASLQLQPKRSQINQPSQLENDT